MPNVLTRVWLLTLVAVFASVGVGLVVLWGLPELLTQHPPGSLTQAERLKAESDVRTALVAFLIAVGGAGTLAFTGRTYVLNRRGQQIDRYSTAVGQLDNENVPVRIGAVHALGRVGAARGRAGHGDPGAGGIRSFELVPDDALPPGPTR